MNIGTYTQHSVAPLLLCYDYEANVKDKHKMLWCVRERVFEFWVNIGSIETVHSLYYIVESAITYKRTKKRSHHSSILLFNGSPVFHFVVSVLSRHIQSLSPLLLHGMRRYNSGVGIVVDCAIVFFGWCYRGMAAKTKYNKRSHHEQRGCGPISSSANISRDRDRELHTSFNFCCFFCHAALEQHSSCHSQIFRRHPWEQGQRQVVGWLFVW